MPASTVNGWEKIGHASREQVIEIFEGMRDKLHALPFILRQLSSFMLKVFPTFNSHINNSPLQTTSLLPSIIDLQAKRKQKTICRNYFTHLSVKFFKQNFFPTLFDAANEVLRSVP